MFARLRCGGNLPLCLAFGTGVLGVLWWLGGWVVGIRYRKQASTVRKRYSVPKTASSGTRRIFKGPQNSRLHSVDSLLPHRTHLQCAKRPPRR